MPTTGGPDVVEVERMELEPTVKADWLPTQLCVKLDRSERDFGLKILYSDQTHRGERFLMCPEYVHLANLLGMPCLMRVLICVKLDD